MSDHAEPVNIGNPHEITISDFAEEIIKLPEPHKVVYQPLPVNDPMQRQPDISKAKSSGLEPKVMRAEGLRKPTRGLKIYRMKGSTERNRDFADYSKKKLDESRRYIGSNSIKED